MLAATRLVTGVCLQLGGEVGSRSRSGWPPVELLWSQVYNDLTPPRTPLPGTFPRHGCASCREHLNQTPVMPPTFDLEQSLTAGLHDTLPEGRTVPNPRIALCEQWGWQSCKGRGGDGRGPARPLHASRRRHSPSCKPLPRGAVRVTESGPPHRSGFISGAKRVRGLRLWRRSVFVRSLTVFVSSVPM